MIWFLSLVGRYPKASVSMIVMICVLLLGLWIYREGREAGEQDVTDAFIEQNDIAETAAAAAYSTVEDCFAAGHQWDVSEGVCIEDPFAESVDDFGLCPDGVWYGDADGSCECRERMPDPERTTP